MSNGNVGFFVEEIPESLNFAGKEVKFPEVYFRYAAAKSEFLQEVRQTVDRMNHDFDDKIGSLDEFVEYGVSWVQDELDPLLKFTMDQLSLNGCYGISQEDFFQKYVAPKLNDIPSIYNSMEEALDDIHRRQAEKNAQHVAERKEKVANGSDELGEMLWNGVRRLGNGVQNLAEAADIYNETIQQKIKDEFIYICYTMVDSFAEALYDHEKMDLRDPVSSEDYKRTRAMMKNLENNKIPESKIDDAAFEIFTKQPFMPEIIEWAVGHYGDPDGHFQKIADAFHIDLSEKKKDLLKAAFSQIDFSTEESLLRGKENLEIKEKDLNTYIEVFHQKIDDKLKEFDLEARTVDGVEYDTREKANKAKELKSFFASLDLSSEDAALKSQQLLAEKEKELGFSDPKFSQKISEQLGVLDKNARIVEGIEYKTREEATEAKRQIDVLSSILSSVELDSVERIQALIDQIQNSNLTIAKAHWVLDRLKVHIEMLNAPRVNHLELCKIAMHVKSKVAIYFGLLILSTILSSILPSLGVLFFLVSTAWLISLFFTTRKNFAKYMEYFILQKNFKMAYFCFELSHMTASDFLTPPPNFK